MLDPEERARGASYMDAYDANSDNIGYDTGKTDNELVGMAKCSKHTLFGVNFVMLLLGIALIFGVMFLRESGSFEISETIVYLTISSAALIMIVSCFGCVGASTKSKCTLIIYIILLLLCLLLEIVAIIIIFADQSLIEENVKTIWDGYSQDQRAKYEEDNDCIGFEECYDSIEQGLNNNLYVIGGITIGIFVFQLAMTIIACCLCSKINKTQQNMKAAGSTYDV